MREALDPLQELLARGGRIERRPGPLGLRLHPRRHLLVLQLRREGQLLVDQAQLAVAGEDAAKDAAEGDLVADSNPVGRVFYASSASICLPASLADEGRRGLGNQVADTEWAEILGAAGFNTCRRATETPFNRVFEVRP